MDQSLRAIMVNAVAPKIIIQASASILWKDEVAAHTYHRTKIDLVRYYEAVSDWTWRPRSCSFMMEAFNVSNVIMVVMAAGTARSMLVPMPL